MKAGGENQNVQLVEDAVAGTHTTTLHARNTFAHHRGTRSLYGSVVVAGINKPLAGSAVVRTQLFTEHRVLHGGLQIMQRSRFNLRHGLTLRLHDGIVETLHQTQVFRVFADALHHFRVGTKIRTLLVREAAIVDLHDPLRRTLKLRYPGCARQGRNNLHARRAIAHHADRAALQRQVFRPTRRMKDFAREGFEAWQSRHVRVVQHTARHNDHVEVRTRAIRGLQIPVATAPFA